ncbi:MAG: hypothetical protein HXK79_07380 [Lachnospiraceae bacterium]|nr:hypothetical protein [Lachnospiraceae bacterium]
MTNYSLISKEIEALTSDVSDLIANLSNVSALLNTELTGGWVRTLRLMISLLRTLRARRLRQRKKRKKD